MTATAEEVGKTRQLSLSVPTMDCSSCAAKVEGALGQLDGVQDVEPRPTTGVVTVVYDPVRTDETAVVTAVESAGYDVDWSGTGDSASIAPPTAVWRSKRAVGTWIGAVALVAGLTVRFLLPEWNITAVETGLGGLAVADVFFLLATVVAGVPVVRGGYYSLRARQLDIDLLMGLAIVVATGLGLYIEAATLAVLFSIAELLEQYAMDRTRDSVRELLELAPQEATVYRDGEQQVVPVEEVRIGERLAVRPGERIPVDGSVLEGETTVDQSPITGESVPVDKRIGDEVFAGTVNETGYVEIEAESVAADSTLSQIIELVQNAEANKTEKEQFVDRFARYYTPVVVVFALLTAILPPLAIESTATLDIAGFTHVFTGEWRPWVVRGLTLLVIACPCAFVISTPVSVTSGITAAARNGVLIKGGNHLEAMGEVDAIAFDKTGTLTKGELTVTDVVAVGGEDSDKLLRYASGLEQRSEHPIADAVLEEANEHGVDPMSVSEFDAITGKGVTARIEGNSYYAGKPQLFEELGFDFGATGPMTDGGITETEIEQQSSDRECYPSETSLSETISRLESDGKTVVLVGTEDRIVGIIGIADEIRPGAKRAVDRLQQLGLEAVMLTGDNEGTARAVAAELDIAYRAELLPEQKVDAVESLAAEHGDVAMVGDGINDAPALATATVGIAMGAAGTDTAIETADIALLGDEIGLLPYVYALSNSANSVIRQNIWSSLGVKLLLAIGVPFGYVSVALAVIVGDMGMSLGVTGNAMRLSRLSPEDDN